MKRLSSLVFLWCCCTGCSHSTQADCLALPCPLPLAIRLSVTASAGGPVPGLTLTVSGAESATGQCDVGESATSCSVPGPSGTYTLQLTAAGFQPKTLGVVVTGTSPACGCPTADTQQLSVVLQHEA